MKTALDEDLCAVAIDQALKLGADYADARLEVRYRENISVINNKVVRIFAINSAGLGVRVHVGGTWGFQSNTDLTKSSATSAVETAVRAAKRAGQYMTNPIGLAETKAYRDSYTVPAKVDIEDVSLEDKLVDIQSWEKDVHLSKNITLGKVEYLGIKINKLFVNSEGASIKSENNVTLAEIRAGAEKGGITQFYDEEMGGTGGYELFEEKNISGHCNRVGTKALKLCDAKVAKSEADATVIMDPGFVGLLVHEICGHASEGDRILGYEAAWAGASWWLGLVGKKIGSDLMTVYDDPTVPGTVGYYLYDDEGVKARPKVLVKEGVVKEHMQSRSTAVEFEKRYKIPIEANAGMRAATYEYFPLVRMSNTFWGPGNMELEDIISDTKHGFFVVDHKGCSIDDIRYNWVVVPNEAYEIRNGELSTHVRGLSVMSTAPKFFPTVDCVSKNVEHHFNPGCGKGDPMQKLYTGFGGPSIRGKADILGK